MTDKPFNIVAYLPQFSGIYVAASTNDWTINTVLTTGDWTDLTGGAFLFETQIDMAGWTKQGLTAFFANQFVQRAIPYTVFGASAAPTGGAEVLDQIIVSDVPLDTTPLTLGVANVGYPTTPDDYMTIKFSQGFQFTQTTNAPTTMTQGDTWTTGSGEPTAAGTLYVYRLIQILKTPPAPADRVNCPEYRYVAQGIATAEPEFVYLNRLRRSYELQNS